MHSGTVAMLLKRIQYLKNHIDMITSEEQQISAAHNKLLCIQQQGMWISETSQCSGSLFDNVYTCFKLTVNLQIVVDVLAEFCLTSLRRLCAIADQFQKSIFEAEAASTIASRQSRSYFESASSVPYHNGTIASRLLWMDLKPPNQFFSPQEQARIRLRRQYLFQHFQQFLLLNL